MPDPRMAGLIIICRDHPASCVRSWQKWLYSCRVCQQQHPPCFAVESVGSTLHEHSLFFRPSMELITALAQPTPACTEIAPNGQLRLHAPHSMHASRFWIITCLLFILNTSCGHTSKHIPQPVHLFSSSCRVTTSLR